MSKFQVHRFYLFSMKNGKKKLAYGATPEDALETLSFRLNEEEMAQIEREEYTIFKQQELHKYIHLLG